MFVFLSTYLVYIEKGCWGVCKDCRPKCTVGNKPVMKTFAVNSYIQLIELALRSIQFL